MILYEFLCTFYIIQKIENNLLNLPTLPDALYVNLIEYNKTL